MKRIVWVIASAIGVLCVCNQAFAIGGYWKATEGKAYTAKLTDQANNVVIGEFKETVRWQWEEDGKLTITEWNDGAIFTFKDEAGKEQKIENATIKARILDLAPGMTGKLKGNIKEALK